jgi:hypothetical protein
MMDYLFGLASLIIIGLICYNAGYQKALRDDRAWRAWRADNRDGHEGAEDDMQ